MHASTAAAVALSLYTCTSKLHLLRFVAEGRLKTRDSKTRDHIARVEIAGLENGGPVLQAWKTRDNRLWNAKCLLMHKIQFHRTSQNTYITLQSIN